MAEHSRPVFVSAASTWEIGIKAAKGKLRLPSGGEERIKEAMVDAGFLELPVTWDHGLAVRTLADHHLDPFDRLLIIQSRLENLTMVTNDRLFPRYGIDVLW
jgi:PIN domain nuclease of toxin-antitoxin system